MFTPPKAKPPVASGLLATMKGMLPQTSAVPRKPGAVGPAALAARQMAAKRASNQKANEVKWIQAMSPEDQMRFAAMVGGGKPKPAATPGLHLPGSQEGIFQSQRNRVGEEYQLGLADNNYQRGVANQGFANQLRDLTQQYGQVRGELPDEYAGRGILGSGVFKSQLQKLVQQRMRASGDIHQQKASAIGAYDIGRTALERQRSSQLAEIEAQRQRAMAQYAAGSIK